MATREPTTPTAIWKCCREWIGPLLGGIYPPGKCGLCGEVPTWHRDDPESPHLKP